MEGEGVGGGGGWASRLYRSLQRKKIMVHELIGLMAKDRNGQEMVGGGRKKGGRKQASKQRRKEGRTRRCGRMGMARRTEDVTVKQTEVVAVAAEEVVFVCWLLNVQATG